MDTTIENVNSAESSNDYQHMLAGFWIRFWAYLIDVIVIASINRIIVHPIFNLLNLDKQLLFTSTTTVVTTIIFFAYFVLMTKYFQQTLGKMILGIKVISLKEEKLDWATIIFREFIGRYISKTIVILYLVAAFTPKKQALHDLFSDTLVIHEKVYTKISTVANG